MPQTTNHPASAVPFAVRDCALITITAGYKAQNLREFRTALDRVATNSIYHHFWGRLLRAQFDEPEYNNDFASWIYHALHDKPLAERLSMVTPTDFDDLESLRQEIIEAVELRLDESEMVPWATTDQQFHFLKSQIVVFDTGLRFDQPEALFPQLAQLTTGSIYYHFIDARSRTLERCDDFSTWLAGFGDTYQRLASRLCSVDPYFSSLGELRHRVTQAFSQYFEEAAR